MAAAGGALATRGGDGAKNLPPEGGALKVLARGGLKVLAGCSPKRPKVFPGALTGPVFTLCWLEGRGGAWNRFTAAVAVGAAILGCP